VQVKPSVFLVEDHELTRRGLVQVLDDEGFRIAGEAASLAVARALAPRLDFSIALIDVYLRDGDGVELASWLRETRPEVEVVVMSASAEPEDLFRALRAGAVGYLTKDMSTTRLGETLRAVACGEAPLSRQMTTVLVREFQRINGRHAADSAELRSRLTPREWEILNLLAEGMRTGEVAAELVVSVETVRSHVKAILRKLDVHTRAAAVAQLEHMRHATPALARG
jgi:NarL family two-component system response regulator LiaR